MKRFILTVAMVFTFFTVTAMAEENISLKIDGTEVEFDVMPQIIEGRTMVPVRAIFESVGAEVTWDNETKTVTGIKGNTTVKMTVDSNFETINGKAVEMDAAPQIIDGRTLAPARYVAEAFGCSVEWDGENKAVSITTPIEETSAEITTEETTKAIEIVEANTDYENWIDFIMAEDNKPDDIDFTKIPNDKLRTLHCDVRYDFEQSELPQSLFNDSENMADLIKNDPDKFADKILEIWEKNSAAHIVKYMIDAEETYTVSGEEDLYKLITKFESDCYLYGSDNIGLAMCKVDDDTYLTLLEMADDAYLTYCSYIAIVYNEDFGFKYYTLEQSFDNLYAICEVTKDSRGNYGMIEDSKDNKLNFINAVGQLIEKEKA